MQIGSISALGYGHGHAAPARDVGVASIERRSSLSVDTNKDGRAELRSTSSSGAAGVAGGRGRYSGVFGYDRNGVAVDGNSDGRKDAGVENEIRFAARAGGYRGSSATVSTGYAVRSGNTQAQGAETNTVTVRRSEGRDGSRTTSLETRGQENTKVVTERGSVSVASTSRDKVTETVKRSGERNSEVTSANTLKVTGSGSGEAESSVSSSVTVRGANAGRVSIAITQSVSNSYANVQQSTASSIRIS